MAELRRAELTKNGAGMVMDQSVRHARSGRAALMLTALILVAVNLRVGVTSASALLPALTESGSLTPLTAIIIPALPTAVFAVAGVGTARLAARAGVERTVLIGTATLAAGLLIRAVSQPWVIVAGTVVATAGLAVVNILLPAVVRAHFARRISSVTTAYTVAMSVGAAAAAAAAVPVSEALGSPAAGLAAWATPAVLGLVVWCAVMPWARPAGGVVIGGGSGGVSERGSGGGSTPARPRIPAGTSLLAGYFALQALLSYVVMGWLPTIARDAGIPASRAGLLLGIAMAIGIPATAVVVSLGRDARRMRAGFILVAAASVAALFGMLFAPTTFPELWAALLGVGMSAFPLVLALIAGFGEDANATALVSTIVQSTGYSVATVGPLGAGALRQFSGSWSLVLILLIGSALLQGAIGLALTRVVAARGRRETAAP